MAVESEVKISQRFLWFSNTIFHQLVAITFGYICYITLTNDLPNIRVCHYLMSTVAYIPLMAEGFILYTETNTWTLHLNRIERAWIHAGLLATSIILASVGIIVRINASVEHFQTSHAILGLISWILCFVLALTGAIAINSSKLKHYFRPVTIKTIHSCLGLSCYLTGIASLFLGLDSFEGLISVQELIILKILVIMITIWSVVGTLKLFFNNVKRVLFT